MPIRGVYFKLGQNIAATLSISTATPISIVVCSRCAWVKPILKFAHFIIARKDLQNKWFFPVLEFTSVRTRQVRPQASV
jgi:hypothetical protein